MNEWKLREVRENLTISGSKFDSQVTAWYLLDPQMWSFRSVADGEDLIEAKAAQLAELTGRTVYGRVTERPYPVEAWAEETLRNAPRPMPGALLTVERDKQMLASWNLAEKLVYLGVDLDLPMIGRREDALTAQLADLDQVMAGPGLEAIPARGDDMAWLLARSFALGCPMPYQTEDAEQFTWSHTDLAEFVNAVDWSAVPLADSVRVHSVLGSQTVSRHVVVLSVGPMADIDVPVSHEPWMAKTDALPFPVEWSWRYQVQTPQQTAKKMVALTDRIRAQIEHYTVDHDIDPPQQLERQADRASAVEDEMRSEFDGLSTRTTGHYRIAVSAQTEEEALSRARQVMDLYRPAIKMVRELDQYRLAREFVPGQPLANRGHTRHLPVLKVAAGLPAVTTEVGDRRGIVLGRVADASQAVVWDPWYGPEVLESSGLTPIVGTMGSGKSWLGGGIVYKTVQQGSPWTLMDPSGLLARLADLPELRSVSHVVRLLNSDPGTLNPYALVPEPFPRQFTDEQDPDRALALAKEAAAAQRRDLVYDTLRWCLPVATSRREEVQSVLRDAIHAVEAGVLASPRDVISRLESTGDDLAKMVARRLQEASERELSRLFFPSPGCRDWLDSSGHRLVIYSLVGLPEIDERRPLEEWGTSELLTRPILSLAAWATLRGALLRGRHERKGILLDEMHEITKTGSGSGLVQKISTDSRKNNIAALVLTQNADRVIGQQVNNLIGSAFVGRTIDAEAQAAACDLLGLPRGAGYESTFSGLSAHSRRDSRKGRPREFVFKDGMGGIDGQGGMEKIVVDFSAHLELVEALNTTADPTRAPRSRPVEVA
ncbi:MAG: ATP-binding protein [Micrococcales bacterium]|nr:ATP-binding protein [Micrococcales bacterium]